MLEATAPQQTLCKKRAVRMPIHKQNKWLDGAREGASPIEMCSKRADFVVTSTRASYGADKNVLDLDTYKDNTTAKCCNCVCACALRNQGNDTSSSGERFTTKMYSQPSSAWAPSRRKNLRLSRYRGSVLLKIYITSTSLPLAVLVERKCCCNCDSWLPHAPVINSNTLKGL